MRLRSLETIFETSYFEITFICG